MKKYEIVTDWHEAAGIDVVESKCAYETYGDVRIVPVVLAFIHRCSREFVEDYVFAGEMKRLCSLLEQMYVLDGTCGTADYEKSVLDKITKPEGSEKTEWPGWVDFLTKVQSVQQSVYEGIKEHPGPYLPVFQRRRLWKIEHGYFCKRCHHETSDSDYELRVIGRFGFGFVPEDKVLSRKRILFRRYG